MGRYHEEYFKYESVNCFNPNFLFMLKLKLFGVKIVEYAGKIEAVFYLYKGKLYMTKYSAF